MSPEKHLITTNHSFIAELYQSYASTLLLYICQQVPTREDAEDILLEVFQAAIESELLAKLDSSKRRSWLWAVAHNKASDYYRLVHRRPIPATGLEEVEDVLYANDFYAPESYALRQETYTELYMHVSSLPELQQEILRLRFACGLRCSEIAQHLNKSSVSIRVMLSRSLNLLRDLYTQHREDTADGQK